MAEKTEGRCDCTAPPALTPVGVLHRASARETVHRCQIVHRLVEDRVIVRILGDAVLSVDVGHDLIVNAVRHGAIEHHLNVEAVTRLTGVPQRLR